MKILIIHEAEYIQKVIFEYQIIPEIWASQGEDVYVIDYPGAWRKNKKWYDLGSLRTQTLPNTKRAGKSKGVTLIRPGIIKIPGLSRLSASIVYWFVIPRIIKKYKIEKIFMYSVPTNGLPAILWAKFFKIPIYFRLLDVLHELVPYKMLVLPTYIIERLVYPRVAQMTAITPKLTKYAIKLGAAKNSTTYLPTASDGDLFFNQPKDLFLMKKLGIKKTDKVITFAGTLYNFSGLDQVLDYFGKNVQRYPKLKFLILGHGEQEGELHRIIKSNHIENRVIMGGFIEYQELGKYLNLSDICINPFQRNRVTDIIFPSKIYQYLACEKPVISSKLPGVLEIFPDMKGKNNIFYFDFRKTSDFFRVLESIKIRQIQNTEPALQDIANIILRDLETLT